MTRHLDDRQITTAVAGLELERSSGEHLAGCLECRRRVASLSGLIDERRVVLTAVEPDRQAARAAVLARLAAEAGVAAPPRRPRAWWRPVAAAAAAVLVAAAAWLLAPDAPQPSTGRSDLSVEEILAEVDALLDDDSIPGFEVIDPGLDTLESYAQSGSS